MAVMSKKIQIKSKTENDILDITDKVSQVIKESKIENGAGLVFVVGSTAAIRTIKYEPELQKDFPDMLSRLVPRNIVCAHDNTWHDEYGHSQFKVFLIGPSLTIPILEGNLTLGTWQQIVLVEMDTRPTERKIILQVIGE